MGCSTSIKPSKLSEPELIKKVIPNEQIPNKQEQENNQQKHAVQQEKIVTNDKSSQKSKLNRTIVPALPLDFKPRPPKKLKEYEMKDKLQKKAWTKDVCIGQRVLDLVEMDDLQALGMQKNHKPKSIKVFQKEGGYIIGFQVKYQMIKNPQKIVMGFLHRIYKPKQIEKEFVLDDDEYITSLIGRKGLWIDQFGIKTSKNREFKLGGEGGGPFSYDAPQGFHFCDFGSCTWEYSSAIMADVTPIPDIDQSPQKDYSRFFNDPEFLQIFSHVLDFLPLSNCCKLFKLSKKFAQLRFVPRFVDRQILLCTKENLESIRKYLLKILKHSKNVGLYKYGQKFYVDDKNKIVNPNGKDMNFWQIVEQGGDGIEPTGSCWKTSFQMSKIMQEGTFEDFFNEESLEALYTGQMIISAGGIFKDIGFGSVGYVKLEIVGDMGKIIFNSEKTDSCKQSGTNIVVNYIRDLNVKANPVKFRLIVGGKDQCYWAGFYGCQISGVFLKCWPKLEE